MDISKRDTRLLNKASRIVNKAQGNSTNGKRGFTLVELLAVIGVIGILLAISFPAVQTVRQAARRTHCSSNIRQILTASMAFESTGKGMPPADDGNGAGFIVALLPFLDQQQLSDRWKEPLAGPETYQDRLRELGDSEVPIIHCPASSLTRTVIPNQGRFAIHYYGIAGPSGSATPSGKTYQYNVLASSPSAGPVGIQGMFSPSSKGKFVPRRLKDVRDGLSNTFAIGEISDFNVDVPEASKLLGGWAFGAAYDSNRMVSKMYGMKTLSLAINSNVNSLNDLPFSSNHSGGSQFGFVDGAVRYVSYQISVDVLKTYASINETEEIEKLESY